jgi:ubiquinone/menaquinone biosynthesis C-methylase UbiE
MSDIRSEPTPFAEVDNLPPHIVGLLHDALQRMAAHPEIQRVRGVALDALQPAPGQRLLDAGAGIGEVARQLADLVAPDGSVVALDRSAATVRAAADRHDGSAVEYVPGDVTALDFRDGGFDGVRCERVLQHVPDPDRAIAELIRVTRAGGRVCLIDTDWDSLALDGVPAELVAAVREQFARRDMAHHSDMGRTLRRRLVRAGLDQVTATPVVLYFDTPGSAAVVLPFINRQVPPEARMIPDHLREEWFGAIDAAGERGEFLAVLTMWVVCGIRPARG